MTGATNGGRRSLAALVAAIAFTSGGVGVAWAQQQGAEPHGAPARPAVRPAQPGSLPARPGAMPGGKPGGPSQHGPSRPIGAQSDPHGNAAHGAANAGHGAGHEPQHINWSYGLLGERDGVQPSLLYRPTGMPVPFLANVINFGALALLGVRFGRKPVREGLAKRRETLMREMDEAARLKREAEARLQTYKKRLEKVGDEVERIKTDYAAQAKRDQERIVREAEEKRQRMRRDADFLLEQERKAAVERLTERTVDEAVRRAEGLLRSGVSDADQQRLADEYLRDVSALAGAAPAGGAA